MLLAAAAGECVPLQPGVESGDLSGWGPAGQVPTLRVSQTQGGGGQGCRKCDPWDPVGPDKTYLVRQQNSTFNQLSVDDQIQIFQIQSQINPLPSNKGMVVSCPTGCGETMKNSHIFQSVVLNPEEQTSIEKLINGNIYEMKKTLIRWNQNITKI